MMFLTYAHLSAHLDSLGLFHMDLTLERMHHALSRLNLLHAPCPVVQVVGTNGKGSTASFLASLGKAHGLRTGLYTSPHFVSPRERILCNGAVLPEELWARLGSAVYEAEPRLTYFEFLTVLAALAFAELGMELVVLEAGLGGRWDATTALPAHMLCVTPISMDHEHVLGTTLHAIAADKADALRPGMTALHAPQQPDVLAVLRQKAQATGSRLLSAEDFSLPPLCADMSCALGLAGPHQHVNARLALAAWRTLCTQRGMVSDATREAQGLAQAFLPGRLQSVVLGDAAAPETDGAHGTPASAAGERLPQLPLPLILDGAHNPHGLTALRAALTANTVQPSAVIFSCLSDKDVEHMLPLILEVAAGAPLWIPTIAHNARAAAGETLAAQLNAHAGAAPAPALAPAPAPALATAVPTLHDALQAVRNPAHRRGSGPVLLCGSLYLLGEFFVAHPQFLQSPHACCEVV